MADYIEREATVNLLQSLGSRDYRREKGTIQEAIKMVFCPEYTPSCDVEPVRHGRWKKRKNWDKYVCSECSSEEDMARHYCPNCGSKMDLEKDT